MSKTTEQDGRTMTPQQVVELFGRTIFWNYGENWPGDCAKTAEYPLEAHSYTPDDPDEPRKVTLRYEAGECCVHVATMHPIRHHQDAESGITDYDVEFVQKLPIAIPALLSEIDRLRATIGTLPPGAHPDEINPRDSTWLKERANWEREVAAMREHLATLRAEHGRMREACLLAIEYVDTPAIEFLAKHDGLGPGQGRILVANALRSAVAPSPSPSKGIADGL